MHAKLGNDSSGVPNVGLEPLGRAMRFKIRKGLDIPIPGAPEQAVAESAERPVAGFRCCGGRLGLLARTSFEGLSAGPIEGFDTVGEEGRLEGEEMFFEGRDRKL